MVSFHPYTISNDKLFFTSNFFCCAQLNVLVWSIEEIKDSQHLLNEAKMGGAKGGRLEFLQLLYTRGLVIEFSDAVSSAVASGSVPLLEWLESNDLCEIIGPYTIHPSYWILSIAFKEIEMLKFLLQRYGEGNLNSDMDGFVSIARNMLEKNSNKPPST